jgi:LacI family transcriptional regulator
MEAALHAMRGRVDGLIVMAPDVATRALLDELSGELVAVLLNPPATDGTCSAVRVDNVGGARAMVRHLVRLGRKRIAMITGDERNHDAHERRRGYRAALRAARLPLGAELEAAGDFTEPSGYAAAQALLRLPRRPDAIFAANDAMAVGALSALRDAGVHVPDDVALVGFDDIPIARYLTPPLTSVHVDMEALGRRATELAVEAIGARRDRSRAPKTHDELLPTTLVVRSSCGAGEGRRARGAPRQRGTQRKPKRPRAPSNGRAATTG